MSSANKQRIHCMPADMQVLQASKSFTGEALQVAVRPQMRIADSACASRSSIVNRSVETIAWAPGNQSSVKTDKTKTIFNLHEFGYIEMYFPIAVLAVDWLFILLWKITLKTQE